MLKKQDFLYRMAEKIEIVENDQQSNLQQWKLSFDKKYEQFLALEGNIQQSPDGASINSINEWIKNLEVQKILTICLQKFPLCLLNVLPLLCL